MLGIVLQQNGLLRTSVARLQAPIGKNGLGIFAQRVRYESTQASAPEATAKRSMPIQIRYPYYVPRVGLSGISLPVYSDIRNARSRWLTQIRKVDGDANVCACP